MVTDSLAASVGALLPAPELPLADVLAPAQEAGVPVVTAPSTDVNQELPLADVPSQEAGIPVVPALGSLVHRYTSFLSWCLYGVSRGCSVCLRIPRWPK